MLPCCILRAVLRCQGATPYRLDVTVRALRRNAKRTWWTSTNQTVAICVSDGKRGSPACAGCCSAPSALIRTYQTSHGRRIVTIGMPYVLVSPLSRTPTGAPFAWGNFPFRASTPPCGCCAADAIAARSLRASPVFRFIRRSRPATISGFASPSRLKLHCRCGGPRGLVVSQTSARAPTTNSTNEPAAPHRLGYEAHERRVSDL